MSISRKFVSIYFSTSGIQIVEMKDKNTKVKTSERVDLPPNIISENKVLDIDALALVLKNLWKKLKIKERSVAVVVPEFSTITKVLTLPIIEKDEVSEAITWQASEFLPWQEKDTVLDWMIVGETEEKYEVLMVGIEKEVLAGFTNAIDKAGLFPIAVETPSLSLVRISDSGNVGKLVMYLGKGKNIVILAKGQKIFGSSVMAVDDQEEMIDVATRMIDHYKDLKLESVEIGGVGISNEFAEKVYKSTAIQPKLLGSKFTKIQKEIVQLYLIPISLQFKDPAEPADENTINLIPSGIVKEYNFKKLKLQIWSLTLVISYMVWITFFGTLAAYLFLSQQLLQIQGGNIALNSGNPEKVKIINEINEINNLTSKVTSISKIMIYPQDIVNIIYKSKPVGIQIVKYQIDVDKGTIALSGFADTRTTLIDFKKALEENEEFSLVDVPISSLESEKNIPYTMQFLYLSEKVSKETKKN